MALVVHAHMHSRRTGVTRHVESVLPLLVEEFDVALLGRCVEAGVAPLSLRLLFRRAKHEAVVLHAHRNKEVLIGLVLKALGAPVKIVFTRHSGGSPGWLTRLLMRRVDTVVSLTETMANGLPVPSVVVPHGVDRRKFSPAPDRTAAWADLGTGGEEGIGVIGRVRPSKGQQDLVEAVRPLLAGNPEWRVLLIGATGRHAAWAASLSSGTEGAVVLMKERPDIEKVYRGLTIVVQSSREEGFGLTVLEAMASGCCVISTTVGAAPELIRDGQTGYLYPPGDVDALRSILVRLMAEPELADAAGRQAAVEAATRWSMDREVGLLARIYRGLLFDKDGVERKSLQGPSG